MRPNYRAINAVRLKAVNNSDAQRNSEVSRIATQIVEETKCTRTVALKLAEQRVPPTVI